MNIIEQPIPITRPYMPEQERFLSFAKSLWDTRWLTHGGPLVQRLEKELQNKLGIANLVVFANGHLALDSAFKAMGLCDGEAITTPFTYLSTSHAMTMNGLKPVYCDVKESDCTIDETKIEGLITEKTKAIVPVHVYGFPCNTKAIQKIADKHGLKVIYDAAHVFGVKVDGKGIAGFGDASMLSFHATKVFHTVEGGAIAFRDADMRQRLISAKNFGMVGPEQAESISFNAKMTEMHAAMGLANLEIFDWMIQKRKELILHYLKRLSGLSGIRLFSWDKPGVDYNYAYFPIIFEENTYGKSRDEVADLLEQKYKILSRKYFYPLLSDLNCYRQEYNSADTPIAKRLSDAVLTLPLFVDLTHEQVDYICDAIAEIREA